MPIVIGLLPTIFLLLLLQIRPLKSQCYHQPLTDPAVLKLRQLHQTLEDVTCDLINSVTYPDYTPYWGEEFDFIVVGAGSAGSVVASRLSENPNWRVLLLEAGGDPDVTSEIPSLSGTLLGTRLDWNYTTEPDPRYCLGLVNQRCRWPRGKVLGGSSTINTLYYVRGHPENFDSWEREGNVGWGYRNLLPYFKKSEDLESNEVRENEYFSFYHGEEGNLRVESFYQQYDLKVFFQNVSRAFNDLGYKTFNDVNSVLQEGLFYLQGTLRHGRRCSTAKAFIKPTQTRNNFKISKCSLVRKILFNGQRMAYGVEFEKGGDIISVRAQKEVILSAGAVNSPQLLMLSGIGPKDHLDKLGICVIRDLMVGHNLQDHYNTRALYASFDTDVMKPDDDALLKLVFQSEAIAEINGRCNGAGYLTTSQATYPNIMYFFGAYAANSTDVINRLNGLLGYNEIYIQSVAKLNINRGIFSFSPSLVKPKSRGRILLSSTNPRDHPLIYPNYLAEEEDMQSLLEGIAFANKLVRTEAMAQIGARVEKIDIPGCESYLFQSPEYWRCAIRYTGGSLYHPAGSCRMGPRGSPESVVDPDLRVIGISGLRVVDASVMPSVPNGNINAAVVALAERASDIINCFWRFS